MITLTNKKQTLFSAAMIAGALTLTACADSHNNSGITFDNPATSGATQPVILLNLLSLFIQLNQLSLFINMASLAVNIIHNPRLRRLMPLPLMSKIFQAQG